MKQHECSLIYDGFNKIVFSSLFDNGNMGRVIMITPTTFELQTVPDNVENDHPFPKCWFHFNVTGLISNIKYRFIIRNVNLLYSIVNQQQDLYRPVYKYDDTEWQKILENVTLSLIEEERVDLHFTFTIESNFKRVWFAFTFPYTYKDYMDGIFKLQQFKFNYNIYCNVETLINSIQQRPIHLITVTDQSKMCRITEQYFCDQLFPNREKESRSSKFEKNVVLITARIHPGETPSSHVVNGIIKYLIEDQGIYKKKICQIINQGQQAKLLRELFTFMIIPMLNPDGVALGHYRLDSEMQNLNRYYDIPEFEKQPTVFAVKKLVEHLQVQQRLMFYFDLHAHARSKNTFLYGNALDDISQQIVNQLFAKFFSLNSLTFDYESSNFSKKQMSSKDTYETRTKEGCGRVMVYTITGIIHSYTLECGYYKEIPNKLIPSRKKANEELIDNNPDFYAKFGQDLLVSILDIILKNPEPKVNQSLFQNNEKLILDTTQEIIRIDRFKHHQSLKNIKKISDSLLDYIFQKVQKKFTDILQETETIPTTLIQIPKNDLYKNQRKKRPNLFIRKVTNQVNNTTQNSQININKIIIESPFHNENTRNSQSSLSKTPHRDQLQKFQIKLFQKPEIKPEIYQPKIIEALFEETTMNTQENFLRNKIKGQGLKISSPRQNLIDQSLNMKLVTYKQFSSLMGNKSFEEDKVQIKKLNRPKRIISTDGKNKLLQQKYVDAKQQFTDCKVLYQTYLQQSVNVQANSKQQKTSLGKTPKSSYPGKSPFGQTPVKAKKVPRLYLSDICKEQLVQSADESSMGLVEKYNFTLPEKKTKEIIKLVPPAYKFTPEISLNNILGIEAQKSRALYKEYLKVSK